MQEIKDIEIEKAQYRQSLYTKLNDYICGVTGGTLIVCSAITQSVQLFIQKLQNPEYYPNYKALDKFFDFCFYCYIDNNHGKYIQYNPEGWEVLNFAQTYLLYYRNQPDKRVVNRAFMTVSRKNGKTTSAVIQSKFAMIKEHNDAKVYCVSESKSTSTDSALYYAKNIVSNSPALNKRIEQLQYTLRYKNGKSISTYRMLPNREAALNAIKPAMIHIDELHTMKTGAILDKAASGFGSTDNPLLVITSTRGTNTSFFQYEYEQTLRKILKGELRDDSTAIMIFEQDNECECNNPELWIKSNPCLNVSLNSDYLLNQYHKAKLTPSSLKEFFGFHLNMWVDKSKEEQFIETEFIETAYNKGVQIQLNFEWFKGKEVLCGLDMSKTDDLASLIVMHYDKEAKQFYCYPFIYMPNVPSKRIRNRGIDLTEWLLDGSIAECHEKRVDEQQIFDDIVKINNHCNIMGFGHDGYNKSIIIPMIENLRNINNQRIDVQFVSQAIKDITTATKLLDRIMAQEQLAFVNPCMKWQFKNCISITDINNNIKLSKKISRDSIDSIAALINALELWRKDNENEFYRPPEEPVNIKLNW